MLHRFITIASLLGLVASTVLWVRSVSYDDWLAVRAHPRRYQVESGLGLVRLLYYFSYRAADRDTSTRWDAGSDRRSYLGHRAPGFLGFSLGAGDQFVVDAPLNASPSRYAAVLTVPYWFLVALFAAWPARRGLDRLRARMAGRSGVCPACGYDLRATPDRCPECGTIPA